MAQCYLCALDTDDFRLVVPAEGADPVACCRDAPACLSRFLGRAVSERDAAAISRAIAVAEPD